MVIERGRAAMYRTRLRWFSPANQIRLAHANGHATRAEIGRLSHYRQMQKNRVSIFVNPPASQRNATVTGESNSHLRIPNSVTFSQGSAWSSLISCERGFSCVSEVVRAFLGA